MSDFKMKTKVFFGEGALSQLEDIQGERILIITDPFMVKSGTINRITSHIEKRTYEVFDDVVPDPPIGKVVAGVSRMMAFKPDTVIALGGGSAIDTAKAIRDFYLKISNEGPIGLIAIPTTSGTGSEVTSFAVITNPEKNVKYPLVSDELIPDIAILDPALVVTAPPFITADTGMDVLTHAIEAFVSTKANDFSDALAEKAIRLVNQYLLRAFRKGDDIEARNGMHNASCLAGMAFNAVSLGINHSIAHNIGGRFHVPHGRTNAILLPYVIEYNAGIHGYSDETVSESAVRYSKIAGLLGLPNGKPAIGVRSLINYIKKLQKKMNMPTRLSECKVTPEAFAEGKAAVSEGALADACTITNPRVPTARDVIEILDKAF
jgi:alcohol dehydrogenase class IV